MSSPSKPQDKTTLKSSFIWHENWKCTLSLSFKDYLLAFPGDEDDHFMLRIMESFYWDDYTVVRLLARKYRTCFLCRLVGNGDKEVVAKAFVEDACRRSTHGPKYGDGEGK